MPTHVYTQFKEWYEHMVVPKADCSEVMLLYIKNFKFNFRRPGFNYDRDRSPRNGDRDREQDRDNGRPCNSPCDHRSTYPDDYRRC